METTRQYLARLTIDKELIDRYLDKNSHKWSKFDPELGYVHDNYVHRDGIDGSFTTNRIGAFGERQTLAYGDKQSRINTYGNSFTHCDQVNDHETWQEYLAGHLGEPIRNFGTGGHGVYQAYRRMLREEATDHGAQNILFNIFDDDHVRSIMSMRWFHLWEKFFQTCRDKTAPTGRVFYFHATAWDFLSFDLASRDFKERRSFCPTPESLYNLCDQDWVYETFVKEFDVQVAMATKGIAELDLKLLRAHADAVDLTIADPTSEAFIPSIRRVFDTIALKSTLWTLDRLADFTTKNGKNLLMLMSFGGNRIEQDLLHKPRPDTMVTDHIRKLGLRLVDARDLHLSDFAEFKCSTGDYLKRYYIGHYNPRGNHFFAYGIKKSVVDMLKPQPSAYQDHDVVVHAASRWI
jgi:hypothetical protein